MHALILRSIPSQVLSAEERMYRYISFNKYLREKFQDKFCFARMKHAIDTVAMQVCDNNTSKNQIDADKWLSDRVLIWIKIENYHCVCVRARYCARLTYLLRQMIEDGEKRVYKCCRFFSYNKCLSYMRHVHKSISSTIEVIKA